MEKKLRKGVTIIFQEAKWMMMMVIILDAMLI